MKFKEAILWYSLVCFSCSQEAPMNIKVSPTQGKSITFQSSVKLGRKLENPYSVANMQKAFEQLSPQTRSQAADLEIKATHLYVKFCPKTEEELDFLKSNTCLELYSYPLDYEILDKSENHYYVNHTEKDGKPCDYYAAVKVNKALPSNIEYEILEELFIPDENTDTPILTRSGYLLDENFVDELVDLSLKLTGNWNENEIMTKGKSKWRPAGTITYYDEIYKKNLGVEGLKIRAKRWFTTHVGYTNAQGYFSCDGQFKRPADYSLNFERENFHVKDAETGHNNLKGDWNLHFVREELIPNPLKVSSLYTYVTIFRAAYHYCYKDIQGLHRPPARKELQAKIKIEPVNEDKGGLNGVFSHGFFMGITGKHIEIYNHHNPIDEIYATTIHELAHSAHWIRNKKMYHKDIHLIVKESWARGVQYQLTKTVYPNYQEPTFSRGSYTSIVNDLINSANIYRSSFYYYANDSYWNVAPKSYTDRVEGYTLKQIEDALDGVKTWEGWKANIKKIPNNTKQYVDEAFNFWSGQ